MRFNLFERQADAHLRKSREYLGQANLARVEHQAAAEHHTALANIFAERIARIEGEINSALQPRSLVTRQPVEEQLRPTVESVVVYPSRGTRA